MRLCLFGDLERQMRLSSFCRSSICSQPSPLPATAEEEEAAFAGEAERAEAAAGDAVLAGDAALEPLAFASALPPLASPFASCVAAVAGWPMRKLSSNLRCPLNS